MNKAELINAVAASATLGISGREGKLIKINFLPMLIYALGVVAVFAVAVAVQSLDEKVTDVNGVVLVGINALEAVNGHAGIALNGDNIAFLAVGLGEPLLVVAGAGVLMTSLAKRAQENSLSGLEFCYGIPGNVGGGIYMNAGAYGGEISNCLVSVDYIDEINKYDFHDTVDDAIARAKDADSGTIFGWEAPMKVVELTNFNAAYNDGEEPELLEVQTVIL